MRVNLASWQAFAVEALRLCLETSAPQQGELRNLSLVSVVLISDRRMAALHKQFMNIAGPTDVLTFQHGEVFVSVETARANARRFRVPTEEEIRLYIVHGLLHLHGFDDSTALQALRMEAAQKRITARAAAACRA